MWDFVTLRVFTISMTYLWWVWDFVTLVWDFVTQPTRKPNTDGGLRPPLICLSLILNLPDIGLWKSGKLPRSPTRNLFQTQQSLTLLPPCRHLSAGSLRVLSKPGAPPPDPRPRREAEGQAPNACPSACQGGVAPPASRPRPSGAPLRFAALTRAPLPACHSRVNFL